MRRKLLLFSCVLTALSLNVVKAQEYQSMPIASGLNADVIANGEGTVVSSTSIDIDGVNYNYVATDFKLTPTSSPIAYGVPANGLINSIVTATPGLSYQLAPLTGNNSLRLTGTNTGTITFTTPLAAVNLYMLAVTGSGSGTVSAVVNFSDGTTQSFGSLSVPDWFGATNPPPAIQGIGRVNRTTNALEANATNPRMYQITMAISAANQSKPISSVQITKTSSGAEVVNVFAFSAQAYTSCPSPASVTSVSTMDGATVSWPAPATAPAAGYEYYISTDATLPASTVTPTGTVAAGTTTVTLTGYLPGQNYFIWVRSNCSPTEKGFWRQGTFTPAQVAYTYTAGDIGTKYLSSVTTASTTECPGTMSITVPPGYKIASVGTSYSMTAFNGAWQSEQRSLLVCTTSNLAEAALATTTGNAGTTNYNRTGLTIANDLTGTVNFELRAWRTWEGGEPICGTTYNKVDNNTWKVIVTYALDVCTTPAMPTAAPQSMCPTATFADLEATGIIGATYNWFDVPTGGTAIDPATVITAGTYYVSQTVGTCESPRSTGVIVTLNPTPVPTVNPQHVCAGATVDDIVITGAAGATFKYYATLTEGEIPADDLLTNGTYYVTQTVDGCESARTPVAITTTPLPIASEQILCSGSTVANLQATGLEGSVIKWYTASSGGTEMAVTASVGTGTYYVSQTLGTCESNRLQVDVTVSSVVLPTVDDQGICPGATVEDLVASGAPSSIFNWYLAETGGTALAADTPVTAGTYFVSQTIAACESGRTEVAVTINVTDLPTATAQTVCSGSTVNDLSATGEEGATFNWYTDATGGTALTDAMPLVSATYHVSQIVAGCEGPRLPVAITVTDVIDPIVTDQAVCPGTNVAGLDAEISEGGTANWYLTENAATPLTNETAIVAGTYFVSQTVGVCESNRMSVAVTINTVPVPEVESQLVCAGTLVSELTINGVEGASFNWYTNLTSEDALENDAPITAGTYYVSQTSEGCESNRKLVIITVNTTAIPLPDTTQSFCEGAIVDELVENVLEGADFYWYASGTAEEALASDVELVTGTYYLSQSIEGCESQRVGVNVTVTSPVVPAPDTDQDFCEGATVSNLFAGLTTGYSANWYSEDGELLEADTPLATGTYTVTQTFSGCESETVTVNVTVTTIPDAPTAILEQEFEAGETVADLDVEFADGTLINWYVIEEDVWVSIAGNAVLEDGKTYGVTQSLGTCESEIRSIIVNEVLDTSSFDKDQLVVYPNPATDVLNITHKSTLSKVVVSNLLGQEVLRQEASSTSMQLNVSNLQQGTYIVQVYAADGASATLKIVKR